MNYYQKGFFMKPDYLPYWLAALYLPDVGPRRFKQWLEHFSSIKKLFQASKEELFCAGIAARHIHEIQNPNWKQVEKDLTWAQTDPHHLIAFEDPKYPKLLKEIADPPLLLFVCGDPETLNQYQLAMVGSRRATFTGLKNAEQFAHYLAAAGLIITSGLALGIDGASHRGALAAKGVTIAVAGTGLHRIYPHSHQSLAEDILNHRGAIISEFPLSTQPEAYNFPRRNRIISGMSLGVLIIEAAIKSGSLITAHHALEQGREVFALPGSIHQPLMRGCHALIKQGAKLVETAGDILEELAFVFKPVSDYHPCTSQSNSLESLKDLTPKQLHLFEQIEYEITPIDVIILRSGLTAREVSSILLTLELLEIIKSVPGGYIRITQVSKVDNR